MQQSNQPGGRKRRQVRLEIPANLSANYANAVVISYTRNEVVFDFVQVMPNDPRAKVQSRIVMAPANAKLFLRLLGDSLQQYEKQHGEVEMPSRPQSLAEQLFRSARPDDDDEEDADSAPEGESPDE